MIVHSQDGAQGLAPRLREPQITKQESAAKCPAERTDTQEAETSKADCHKHHSAEASGRGASVEKSLGHCGLCTSERLPFPGTTGCPDGEASEEWTREQEAGAADPQGRGPDHTPRPRAAAVQPTLPVPGREVGTVFIGCNFKFKAPSSQAASVSVVDRLFQGEFKSSHWRGCCPVSDWPAGSSPVRSPPQPQNPPHGVFSLRST